MVSYAVAAEKTPNRVRERESESALTALWRNAHALSQGLVTEGGSRLRVVYPGRANQRAGPDFYDAVIATEGGETIVGDVELHLDAPDWYRHGHHVDPGYNGVILHVVLRPRGASETRLQSGVKAPIASIAGVTSTLGDLGDPVAEAMTSGGQALGATLDHLGDARFLARSRGYAMDLARSDGEQVLYRALMEALGYASNRRPFGELAERVPIASLMRLRREPAGTRLLGIRTMLTAAAGLLHCVRPPEQAQQMRALVRHLPKVKPVPASRWKLFRVRPANHPVVRIAGAPHLVERYIETGLVRGLEEEVRRGDAGSAVKWLVAGRFIGPGRAGEMVVNALLPFMHAYSAPKGDPALGSRCIELYGSLPRPDDNEITRETGRRLGPGAVAQVTGVRRQQGLMHLYKSGILAQRAGRPVV